MDTRPVVIPISDSLDYEVFIGRRTPDAPLLGPGKFNLHFRLYDIARSGSVSAEDEVLAFVEARRLTQRVSQVVDFFSKPPWMMKIHSTLSLRLGLPSLVRSRIQDLIFSESESMMHRLNEETSTSLAVYIASVRYSVYLYEPEAELPLEEDIEPRLMPATEDSIQALERFRIEAAESIACAICLDELEVGSEATRMPCSHVYHGDCILNWLRKSYLCPLCRFPMPLSSSSS